MERMSGEMNCVKRRDPKLEAAMFDSLTKLNEWAKMAILLYLIT